MLTNSPSSAHFRGGGISEKQSLTSFHSTMRRTGLHNSLFGAATVVFAGCVFWQGFFERSPAGIVWVCAAYAVLLVLSYLFACAAVPRRVRKAPAMPQEFAKASLGEISQDTRKFLEASIATEERKLGGEMHRLYRFTEEFPNGVWVCEVEVSHDSIVALRRVFESSMSQFFDTGDQLGSGIIICTDP